MNTRISRRADLVAAQSAKVFYTWTAQQDARPLEIVGGAGARFTTADGASWLDLGSMTWNANLGHGHPVMRKALAAAAERGLLVHPGAVFRDKAEAGALLLQIAPPGMRAGKVFLCLSGAEANENAIKMARLVTGRRKIVYRSRSYHGATLGMLSFSGDPRRKAFDPGLPDGVPWDDPYAAGAAPGDLEHVLKRAGARDVAAVLLEGIVGPNGVVVPPRGYWARVRELCDRHGVLLIVDEVLSGFGRVGRWFAVGREDVAPDLITCAKGLTGGYAPGGAVIAGPRVASYFDDHVLSCGLTAYAHPLTCAAIVAAIGVYREERLIERGADLGRWLKPRLRALGAALPWVADCRGTGVLWALDFLESPHADRPATPARMKRFLAALRARRVHVHSRDHMVFLAPPLCAREPDLIEGLTALREATEEAWG